MANRIAPATTAEPAKDVDDDEVTIDPQAIRNELAGGDRVVLPSSLPPSTIVTRLSKEGEEDDDTEDDKSDDDSLSPPPAYASRSKKKQAASKKKPASKKKRAPEPAKTMCCAGDLCQCGGIIFGSNGHPCVFCKERMHGGPCSDGTVEDPNGMTCKKCAKSKSQTGRKSRQTRAKPKQSQPTPTPLATQTNTRGSRGQRAKAAAVAKVPPITRKSTRNKKK